MKKSTIEARQERDRICKVLRESEWPMRTRDIGEHISIPAYVVSNHLRILRKCGKVKMLDIEDVTYTYYYIATLSEKEAIKQLREYSKKTKFAKKYVYGQENTDILRLSKKFYSRMSV